MTANKWYCIAQTTTFDTGCGINVAFEDSSILFTASVRYGTSSINISSCSIQDEYEVSVRLRETSTMWCVDLLCNKDIEPQIDVTDSPYWSSSNVVAGTGTILAVINNISKAFNTEKRYDGESLWEMVNVGDEENPVWAVRPKSIPIETEENPEGGESGGTSSDGGTTAQSEDGETDTEGEEGTEEEKPTSIPVGVVSDVFIVAGGAYNGGKGNGGAGTLGTLNNVEEDADLVQPEAVALVKEAEATHWSLKKLTEFGLNEEKLRKFLEDGKYTNEDYLIKNQYLKKEEADKYYLFWEKINVGTEESPVWAVVPLDHEGNPVGIVSDTFITAGGRNGNSSGQGSATTLGGLANVDDTADNVLTEDVVLFKGINATHWTLRSLSTLGINEEKLQTYLETNKYVTQTFLTDNKYLTKQAADELYMPISEILWERVNVGTEDNPQWAVIPVDYNGNPVGIVSDTFITSGGRKGGSSGTGSSFNRLDSWDNYNPNAGDVLSAVLGYELKTRLDNLNVGLDESKLKEYLDTNEYITKTAGNELYAPLASFNNLNTKVNDFLTGSDIDNTINKWKELEAFLAGQTETSTLADLLAVKADKTALEAFTIRVTTVEGYFTNKAANNALKLGGQLPEYYATASALSTHISTYNTFVNNTYAAHITAYNKHITEYNTYKSATDKRLADLEALWAIDEDNNGLYPKSGRGIWSESYITAGGQGTSGGGSGTGGGLIQNVYSYADLGGVYNNNVLTDTFNAYTINTLATRIGNLENGTTLPDLSGKYLSRNGGKLFGRLHISPTNSDNPLSLYSSYADSDGACRILFAAKDNAFQGYVMSGWGNLMLSHRTYNQIGVGVDGIWCSTDNGATKNALIHSGNIGSYNAGSATKLQTARVIYGQNFDGAAPIFGPAFISSGPDNPNVGVHIGKKGNTINGSNIDGTTSHRLYLNNASTEAVVLALGGGNVLIGTTTDSGYKLDVNGQIKTNGLLIPNYTAIQSKLVDNTTVNVLYITNTDVLRVGHSSYNALLDGRCVGVGVVNTSYKFNVAGTLNATTLYQNGQTLDKYYLPLSGGTISNSNFGALVIKRVNNRGLSAIQFTNTIDGTLGYIGVGGSASDFPFQPEFYDGTKTYALIHSGNVAPSLSAGTGNNTKITVGGVSTEYKIAYAQDCYDAQWAVSAGKLYGSGYTGINVGSSTQPVYFSDGVPVACTSYANATVGSATKLANAKTIWGQSFDGSGDVNGNITPNAHNTYYIGSDSVAFHRTVSNYVYSGNSNNLWLQASNGYGINFQSGATTVGAWNATEFTVNTALKTLSTLTSKQLSTSGDSNTSHLNVKAVFATVDYIHLYVTGGTNNARPLVLQHNYGNVVIGTPTGTSDAKLYVAGNIVATGAITAGSDARYKTRLQDIAVDIETIANAPLFNFKWNDREDDRIHLGTTAQYWAQTDFRNAVIPTTDEKLWTMSYSQIAMGNTIVLARELMPIKRKVSEIDNLKDRLHKAERKIEILEQELNQYRRA